MAQRHEYSASPPWTFIGRAWYQLNLVKTSLARELIPPELNVVDFFGYTLGGVYYAEYEASPAGKFNELVVIPGIVWNPPTSCAWAASVLVDSSAAKTHGIREVGLPSRLATYRRRQIPPVLSSQHTGAKSTVLSSTGIDVMTESYAQALSLGGEGQGPGSEEPRHGQKLLCSLRFAPGVVGCQESPKPILRVPKLMLHLPSFSGSTPFQPDILKYTCQLQCRPRPIPPIGVTAAQDHERLAERKEKEVDAGALSRRQRVPTRSDIQLILSSKPLVSFCFDDMVMTVGAPVKAFEREAPRPVLSSQPPNRAASFAK